MRIIILLSRSHLYEVEEMLFLILYAWRYARGSRYITKSAAQNPISHGAVVANRDVEEKLFLYNCIVCDFLEPD